MTGRVTQAGPAPAKAAAEVPVAPRMTWTPAGPGPRAQPENGLARGPEGLGPGPAGGAAGPWLRVTVIGRAPGRPPAVRVLHAGMGPAPAAGPRRGPSQSVSLPRIR